MTELQKLGHQRQAEKLRKLWQTKEFRRQMAENQIMSGRVPTEKLLCTEASEHTIITIEREES